MDNKVVYWMKEIDRLVLGEMEKPVCVEIDPSNRCQNRCSFCMYRDYLSGNRCDMTMEVFTKLIDELAEIGVKSITFTGGGEPLMNPDICEMVCYAKASGLEIGLVTNGIELGKVSQVIKLFEFIRVSLDAACDSTYRKIKGTSEFSKVIRNIMAITRNPWRPDTGLSFVITDKNADEVEDAKALAKDLKVDYIQFKPAYGSGLHGEPNEIDDGVTVWTSRYVRDDALPCLIAGLIGIVGADGNLYYCCQKRGDERFRLGNVAMEPHGFWEIWKRRYAREFPIEECGICRYMNYAVGYRKYSNKQYIYLKHRNFL